jgi:hypothetical protein
MKADIKERWLVALRSGDYEQGVQSLKTKENKFCCLGVLCDLYLQETQQEWNESKEGSVLCKGWNDYLSTEVIEWSGLADNDPIIDDTNITKYNDILGYNFQQLADLIEKGIPSE